ncbi:MAG: hypothetical protein ACRDUT_11865, partial [Mycobacterium sp.]
SAGRRRLNAIASLLESKVRGYDRSEPYLCRMEAPFRPSRRHPGLLSGGTEIVHADITTWVTPIG